MDTCTINKLFSVLVAYDLLMAQASATEQGSPGRACCLN